MALSPYFIDEQLHMECYYSLFEAHYDSNFVFNGESHDFWECFLVLSGAVCVSADDRVYHLTQNQIIFHKPMELHKFSVESSNGTDVLIFSFKISGRLADQLENKVFRLSETQKRTVHSLLEYMREQYNTVGDFSQKMCVHTYKVRHYLEVSHNVPEFLQVISTYIYRLFLSLISNGHISTESTEPNALIFRQAVNYLNSQLLGQPSVQMVAENCNTSQASLQRVFQKYAGMSVHKFFLKLKLIAATEYLRQGVNVTEVAEKLGFSSQAYFSACYERETGKWPSEV